MVLSWRLRESKSRSTSRDRCDGEPEQLYQRVIRRQLDLGRIGFAGRRHRKCCHRLQQQVLAGTRRLLARRVPPILRSLRHRAADRGAGGDHKNTARSSVSENPSSANKTFLSRDSRKPAGLRENGRLPVTLVMCQLCEFSLACLTKTWSWFLLRAEREIMMHASNGETVQVESKCGGFRGVHFSQSCNSIF
jgi:hypothetical protein